MDKTQEFIDSFLEHAAPQFYDPVKAHEYYIKTRELKGRQTGAGLTSKQKEAFDYSKSEIVKAQTSEEAQLAAETKTQFAALQKTAQVKGEEIRAKLQGIMEGLAQKTTDKLNMLNTKRADQLSTINKKMQDDLRKIVEKQSANLQKVAERKQTDLQQIVDDAKQKITALPNLPKNASADQIAARSAKLDQIRGTASEKKSSVVDKYDAEKENIRDSANTQKDDVRGKAADERDSVNEKSSEERTAVSKETANEKKLQIGSSGSESAKASEQIKSSIADAQKNYETLKQNLATKYDAITQNEFNAIKQTVKSTPVSPSKRSKKIERKQSK